MTKDHLEIRKAEISDLDNVMEIIFLCTAHMISNKIFQWNDSYPSRQAFEEDINKNDLLVLLLKGEVIGCVCVSNIMDDFYKKIKWKTKSNNQHEQNDKTNRTRSNKFISEVRIWRLRSTN